jgi:hypothetical protein
LVPEGVLVLAELGLEEVLVLAEWVPGAWEVLVALGDADPNQRWMMWAQT